MKLSSLPLINSLSINSFLKNSFFINPPANTFANNLFNCITSYMAKPSVVHPIYNQTNLSRKSRQSGNCFHGINSRMLLLFFLGCSAFAWSPTATVLTAQNIIFSFHDNSGLLEAGTHFDTNNPAGPYTVQSLELSMEAVLDGLTENAALNGGADGFGVNSQGGSDQTQRIDNINGQESIEFSFNTAGILQSIDLRYIEETANEAILSFTGGNTFHLNTSTALSGQDDFSINEAFSAGQKIILSISSEAATNENFSLEAIHVQIPENNHAVVGMTAGIFLIVLLRGLRR